MFCFVLFCSNSEVVQPTKQSICDTIEPNKQTNKQTNLRLCFAFKRKEKEKTKRKDKKKRQKEKEKKEKKVEVFFF